MKKERFFFKQKTAYEMRISDWSSDVCSSDLRSSLTACRPNLRPCPEIELTNFVMPDLIRHPALQARIAGPRIDSGMTKAKAEYCHASSTDFRAACSAASAAPARSACEIGRASCRERVCQYV